MVRTFFSPKHHTDVNQRSFTKRDRTIRCVCDTVKQAAIALGMNKTKKKNQYLDWDATDCRLLEFLFTRTRTSVIFIYFAEMPKTETSLEGSRSVFVCFQNKLNK